jgi:hypothetical protein
VSTSLVSAQQPDNLLAKANASNDSERGNSTNKAEAISVEEIRQMQLTIRLLEGRIKELEGKLSKSSETTTTVTTPVTNDDVQVFVPASTTAATQDSNPTNDSNAKTSPFLSFFERTEVSGFVDTYYGYNFNRPPTNNPVLNFDNQLRNFDTKHNQFSLNLIELALESKPTTDSRLGYRVDLNFGPATEIVHAPEPGGLGIFRNLQQGYLSYLAPVGKGLQIDVGKYVTHHGNEVIETKDNWNYSRSFLFTLAIPYYHFGFRATYPLTDRISVMAGVNNGWNNVVENNNRRSYSVQLAVKPTDKITLIQNYTGGPEQLNNNDDWRHLYDATLSYNATAKLGLAANYVYGKDRFKGAGVHWQGIVGYLRYQVNDWLAFAPRFEYYDDHDGFTSGAAQELKAVTITSEQKIKDGLVTRFEYRRDFSNQRFFLKPVNRLVGAQSTFTFGMVYYFSSKQ